MNSFLLLNFAKNVKRRQMPYSTYYFFTMVGWSFASLRVLIGTLRVKVLNGLAGIGWLRLVSTWNGDGM